MIYADAETGANAGSGGGRLGSQFGPDRPLGAVDIGLAKTRRLLKTGTNRKYLKDLK